MTYITSNKTIKNTKERVSLLNDRCGDNGSELEHLNLLETSDLNLIPKSCRNCSQHPSNGGSGICFCILGQPQIT